MFRQVNNIFTGCSFGRMLLLSEGLFAFIVKEMGKPVSPWGTEVIEMHTVMRVLPAKGTEADAEEQNIRQQSQSS